MRNVASRQALSPPIPAIAEHANQPVTGSESGPRRQSQRRVPAVFLARAAIVGAYCHGLIGIETTGWLIRKLRLGNA